VIETAIPLSAAAITYFLVQTSLIAGAIVLTSASASPLQSWYREFMWSAPSYFVSAIVAGMVALIMQHQAYLMVPLAAAPLYISYRAYRMSVDRIDEEAIGNLIMFSQYFTAYAGEFYDINAFDQPGVEYGKKLTFAMMGRSGFAEYLHKVEEIRQRGWAVVR